ncbi:MarR family transcriptional regulator [Pseudomonas sp. JS3066]|jgi:DNA-binding MarR family transcriptional regulator|uniref:MarR family winged helix-turn-helix transcriptional regulator n=1 Tax=unclassified Pseudomonas TaxID=196821 RepID=UPI000EA9FE52|nr:MULTISPECIES: MarR family transcriptional regulator [unclassified Pseudomonas]AYF90667.1 MarR family transcriptional regulator [Pseudomonas sp. DY-1]MDH4652656.1 MarR family transcriptional regulator [Pseudomonas sp. BN606]MRK20530.1 MarR family transcriptional regulator [Pseudomonas sp. JG-B]WVK91766.1 MarR family transcriptional regulator [Pseudomonas sp. JS3066]
MSTPKKRLNRYNPASDDFKKEEFPFYWIARVYGRYNMAMEKTLKKIDLDVPRWRILFILKENGQSSISELSEHAIAKLSTVTKIVYRMKDDGLVDTAPCSNDGRVTQVTITDKGRHMVEEIQVNTAHIFTNSFQGLTEAQIAKLNGTLEKIYANLPED